MNIDLYLVSESCTMFEAKMQGKDVVVLSAIDEDGTSNAYLNERATRRLLVRLQKFIDRIESEKKEIAKFQKMVSDNAKAKM